MKSLLILFLSFLVSVECARVTLLTPNSNLNFTFALSSAGQMSWLTNSSTYNVLHEFSSTCSSGGTPISTGIRGQFRCSPVDTLSSLSSSCAAAGYVAKWNVNRWTCAMDSDTARDATGCSSGKVLQWDGAKYVCGSDKDTLAGIGSCPTGSPYLSWNGTAWVCSTFTGVSVTTPCTEGQILSFISGAWSCAADRSSANSLSSNGACVSGTLVKYGTGGSVTCGADSFTSPTGCNATNTWPKFNSGTSSWACSNGFLGANALLEQNVFNVPVWYNYSTTEITTGANQLGLKWGPSYGFTWSNAGASVLIPFTGKLLYIQYRFYGAPTLSATPTATVYFNGTLQYTYTFSSNPATTGLSNYVTTPLISIPYGTKLTQKLNLNIQTTRAFSFHTIFWFATL